MKSGHLDKDTFHAALRLTVLLTRNYSLASEFVQCDGISLLFDLKQIATFPAQHPLVMLILRHCVESTQVLATAMDREIRNWIINSRHRPSELVSYIKANSHICLRDSSVFVDVTSKKFQLTKFDIAKKNYTITPLDDGKEKPEAEQLNFKPVFTHFGEENLSAVFGGAVKQLVNNIMTFKHEVKNSTDTKLDIQKKRCFVLQCLSELAVSYSVTRCDIMHSSQRRFIYFKIFSPDH
jgi:hypothetical protein